MGIAIAMTIGEGGPLRRFEARCHLVRARSQMLAALLVAWAPLIVFGLASEYMTGRWVPLLHDITVHVQAARRSPGLVFLDHIFPLECRRVIKQLIDCDLIKPEDRPRFDRTLQRTVRLGDWWLPETTLAVFALLLGAGTLRTVSPAGTFALRSGLTAAEWWYALVALPLFEFLLMRSLWRWVVWTRFLVGISRVRLDLDPTHPDRHCGIAFLRLPSLTYGAVLLFAISAVVSAQWAARFQFVSISSFIPLLVVFAAVATVIAFGPLVLFTIQVGITRRDGLLEIGGLAVRNGRWFRNKWVDSAGGAILTSSEAQELAAVGVTYRDSIRATRIWPFEKRDLAWVLAAALAPIIPSMLIRIPHEEWFAMASLLVGKTGIP